MKNSKFTKYFVAMAILGSSGNVFAQPSANGSGAHVFSRLKQIFANSIKATAEDLQAGRTLNCQTYYQNDNKLTQTQMDMSPLYDDVYTSNNNIGSQFYSNNGSSDFRLKTYVPSESEYYTLVDHSSGKIDFYREAIRTNTEDFSLIIEHSTQRDLPDGYDKARTEEAYASTFGDPLLGAMLSVFRPGPSDPKGVVRASGDNLYQVVGYSICRTNLSQEAIQKRVEEKQKEQAEQDALAKAYTTYYSCKPMVASTLDIELINVLRISKNPICYVRDLTVTNLNTCLAFAEKVASSAIAPKDVQASCRQRFKN